MLLPCILLIIASYAYAKSLAHASLQRSYAGLGALLRIPAVALTLFLILNLVKNHFILIPLAFFTLTALWIYYEGL